MASLPNAPQDAPGTDRAAQADELDELTLRRAQRGDDAACCALVRRYERPVFALLSRMLGPGMGHEAVVEDLAQETFLSVFRSLAKFAPLGRARLSTWILTIASRRAIDYLRKRPASNRAIDIDADRLPGDDRADRQAQRLEIARLVQRAVADLAPPYRAALLLREYHGFEYTEIARALDIDLGTVKSRLARARAALRGALAEVRNG